MRASCRALLVAVGVAAVLAIAVGPAAAVNLEFFTPEIRSVFERITFEAGGLRIECRMTVTGSFHRRTFAKVLNGLYGFVSNVTTESCASGSATAGGLPWHQRYNGFAGTLPNIEQVIMNWSAARWTVREFPGVGACTFAGEMAMIYVPERNGTLLGPATNRSLPKEVGASIFCPERLFIRGSGPVSSPGGTNIRITLI